MDLNLKPVRNPDMLYRTENNKTFLLNEKTGKPYYLEEIGTEIWNLLDGRTTISELISKLRQDYSESDSKLKSDLIDFINDLESNHLISLEK